MKPRLFPNAKEVTESLGAFNAVRRHLIGWENIDRRGQSGDVIVCVSCHPVRRPPECWAGAVPLKAPPNRARSAPRTPPPPLATVYVASDRSIGDGTSPRTACLFAFRMRGWTSYAVDPALDDSVSWSMEDDSPVRGLVALPRKIQEVQLDCRRAILVLMHAHVSLADALGCIRSGHISGVVTCPCCNWGERQLETPEGEPPYITYSDHQVLSLKNEFRVWRWADPAVLPDPALPPARRPTAVPSETKPASAPPPPPASAHVAALEEHMQAGFEALAARHRCIKQARGVGLFWAMDIQKNRRGDVIGSVAVPLTPPMVAFKRALLDAGLFALVRGHTVFACPPLIITREQVAAGFGILDEQLHILDRVLEDESEARSAEGESGPSPTARA